MTQNVINASLVPFGVPVVDPSGEALSSLSLEDGELLIGATSNPVVAALLNAGAYITLTPGAGTLTVTATGALSTISGIVVTLRSGSTNHVFNVNMVAAQISARSSGGFAPRFNPQLTGSGAPYPINYVSATGGGDGGCTAIVFGTKAQLGTEVFWDRGGTTSPQTVVGIDPYFVATLSPPPDEPAYFNKTFTDASLTFQSGAVVTLPSGDVSRSIVGLASTNSTLLPFISPDGMVASKRWGNTSVPTSTDPSILIVAGANGPGYPAIGAGTGTGASDLRALSPGLGGGVGFQLTGQAGQGTISGSSSTTITNITDTGNGCSGFAVGDLTRTTLTPQPSTGFIRPTALIIEYVS